jgi:hypothetical protein
VCGEGVCTIRTGSCCSFLLLICVHENTDTIVLFSHGNMLHYQLVYNRIQPYITESNPYTTVYNR